MFLYTLAQKKQQIEYSNFYKNINIYVWSACAAGDMLILNILAALQFPHRRWYLRSKSFWFSLRIRR